MKNLPLPQLLPFLSLLILFSGKIHSHAQSTKNQKDKIKIHELEEYQVESTLHPVLPEDMTVASSILTGDSLHLRQSSTLGETLSWEPGVNSTYHGPGASRPVIRGFDGDRIRILKSGVDSLDVSNTSPDHAVSVEPLLVERIEVLRGSATLLYGSSAIGGTVNVIGKEIPSKLPGTKMEGDFEVSYGSVAQERTAVLSTGGAAKSLAWHVGALYRQSDDVEIPGFPNKVAMEGERSGVLPNSAIETKSGSAGFAWFWEKGSAGLAISGLDSLYGVPGDEVDEPIRIELDQLRFDFRAELLDPLSFLESVKVRGSIADYEHVEEEGGEVGTRFLTNGFETRIEALHKPIGANDMEGAFGLQLRQTDLKAEGEEAFLPPSDTFNWALFLVEKIEKDGWSWDGGFRLENQEISAADSPGKIDHSGVSASTGFVLKPNENYRIALSVAYSQRIPTAQELLANGPHAATQAFELGDSSLNVEEALGLDFSLRKIEGNITGSINLFYNDFKNFIFLERTSGRMDDLPVFNYRALEAEFYGAEMEASIHILHEKGKHLHMDLLLDFVRATNSELDSPLPRIPPLRFGGRLRYEMPKLRAGVEIRTVDSQKRTAAFESQTGGYTFLNADITYSIQGWPGFTKNLEFFVIGTNLANEEARNHVSFIKDQAPLPGRNVKIGFRTRF